MNERLKALGRAVLQLLMALVGGAAGYVLGIVGCFALTIFNPYYPGYEPTWAPTWLPLVPAVLGAFCAGGLANLILEPAVRFAEVRPDPA